MFEPDVQILEYFGAFRDHRSDEVSNEICIITASCI